MKNGNFIEKGRDLSIRSLFP